MFETYIYMFVHGVCRSPFLGLGPHGTEKLEACLVQLSAYGFPCSGVFGPFWLKHPGHGAVPGGVSSLHW
jgi:hypothetical protein